MSSLSNMVQAVKRYLWTPRSAYKYWDTTTRQRTPKTSTVHRNHDLEREMDGMEMQPLTRVVARQNQVEGMHRTGTEEEWQLEGEGNWGRSWINCDGVRVVENDVWWS